MDTTKSAERLIAMRTERGLSQEDVAKALSIDRTTYNKYERGGSIKRNVEKLANYFHVSTDYLLGNDDTPPSTKQQANTISILTDAEIKLALQIRNLPESDQETIQLIASKTKKKTAEEPPKLKAAV